MNDNPYSPPLTETHAADQWPGVVVRSRCPLDIVVDRAIEVRLAGDELEHQIEQAARECGYKIKDCQSQEWTLRRGSLWHTLYTFRIEKLPTTVTIRLLSPGQLHLRLNCHSRLTISTPGDSKRFYREMDKLEAELTAANFE